MLERRSILALPSAEPAGREETAPAALTPLAVRGLTFEVGAARLIDGIDLTLDGNGLAVIMGPNGAGKSLLLRLLHGLLIATGGTVRFGGEPIGENLRRRQAMVFQRPVLLRRSVAANVDFALKLKGGQARPERRNRLLDHVGLLDRAKQPARLLSGGEQQRLALARALATEPEVLFLDEPTASLDPASVQMIEAIVRNAKSQGVTVIFVTHDLGQAKRLADEVVFLHKGRLAEHTAAGRFFTDPASQVAKAYLEGRILV
jgi:tungstate transport system ATP-binding protein